jgi:hypothetical protein
MLDQIQKLMISDEQTSVYDRIRENPGKAEIRDHPLVANVKDLTDILASASKERADMDNNAGESSDECTTTRCTHRTMDRNLHI